MKILKGIRSRLSVVSIYRIKWVLVIAILWTLVDVFRWIRFMEKPYVERSETVYQFLTPGAVLLRAFLDFVMGLFMGNLLVVRFRKMFHEYSMLGNFVLKTLILIGASFTINFITHVAYSVFTLHLSFKQSLLNFQGEILHRSWLVDHMGTWLIIFAFTQLLIEISEKYSPGVFADILLGKYLQPKIEKRIVMFVDLNDSTSVAEQLGHEKYFLFIRDFIAVISLALLENKGRIYQYVGDEVVVSWRYSEKNERSCLKAILDARRGIQLRSEIFQRSFGIIPEFRIGLHVGEVTVGEIGIIKRDLAMSGDTMNTTARIRDACTELNKNFIASKEFIDHIHLKDWQAEYLGVFELRGKDKTVELFALKI